MLLRREVIGFAEAGNWAKKQCASSVPQGERPWKLPSLAELYFDGEHMGT